MRKFQILAKILSWKAISLCEMTELKGIFYFEVIICMRITGILINYFFQKQFFMKNLGENAWFGSISFTPVECTTKSEVLYNSK